MKLVYNPTCTVQANMALDIDVAKKAGYDGIELQLSKIDSLLAAGLTLDHVKDMLGDFPVYGIGFIADIERQGEGKKELLNETERVCRIAKELNCPNIQILTGPLAMGTAGNPMYPGVFVTDEYKELLKKDWKEIRGITAKGIADICDIGKNYGISFYLETLGWTPCGALKRGVEVIDEAGRDNVGIVMDFWHLYVTDSTPDEVAKLDKKYINGVHFCDSLAKPDNGKIDQTLRDVYPGHGCAPIKEYVDAVKAAGYDGWMSGECFSSKHTQLDGYDVAYVMKKYMEYTLY